MRDAAVSLQWLAGFDARDPGSADHPIDDYVSGLNAGIKGMRIGVPTNYFFDNIDPEVEAAVRDAVDHYKSEGAIISEVTIPMANQIMSVEFGLCMPEASAYHQEMLRERGDLYEDDVRAFLEAGEMIPATDYIKALRVRQIMKQAWQTMYESVDVIIAPSVPATATQRGQDSIDWGKGTIEELTPAFVRLSAPANVIGIPSVAVPCGFAKSGLPISFQLMGQPFDEAGILRAAQTYEASHDWHNQSPNL